MHHSSGSPRHRGTWVLVAAIVVAGCAAGDARFTVDAPAGFWSGLWHGMISCITLIIGIFNDTVSVYEVNNTGGWYDFGFLIGAGGIWGGSPTVTVGRRRRRRRHDAEWDEIGTKVEAKIRRRIREWAEAEPDEDWKVVEDKAEAKLKRRFRQWAEEP
jgi:hypothetical protein